MKACGVAIGMLLLLLLLLVVVDIILLLFCVAATEHVANCVNCFLFRSSLVAVVAFGFWRGAGGGAGVAWAARDPECERGVARCGCMLRDVGWNGVQ